MVTARCSGDPDAMVAQSAAVLEALERTALKKPVPPVVLRSKTTICNEIEADLGSKLPPSARKYAAWWGPVSAEAGQQKETQAWVLPRRKKPGD